MIQHPPKMELREKEDNLSLWKMELSMKESGMKLLTREMEEVIKSGLMDLFMKDIGEMIRLMEEEG